jgi:hypothetical protein
MADSQEAVRRLTIVTSAPGADQAAASLTGVAKAMDGVTVASTNTDKATLSLDQKFASMERRYVTSVRAQQDYEKTQRLVNQAVAQNPALQDRANAVLAAAKDRHDQLAGSQKALGVITSDLNGRVQASAGSFGVVGQALTALGPAGLASAAALGLAATGFYAASAGAHELAQKARELKDFSESTGLTVTQVQALRSEATKFGVDSDTLQAGLQKFTTGFQDLRLGTGDLLTQVRRINPALADEMAAATDTATAFTLFGRAVAQTTNIFERNALARAGLGKGGPSVAEFLGNVGDVKALASAYDAAGKGLQSGMIDKLKDLDLQISKTTGAARQNLETIFAEPVLNAELRFAQGFLSISEIAKNFTISDNLKKLLSIGLSSIPIVGPLGSLAVAGVKALTAPSAPSMANFQSPANSFSAFQGQGAGPSNANAVAATGGKTPEALAADWKNYVAVLGTAATPTERLNAQIAELGVKAKEAGQGADVLARGIAGLKLDDAIARQSAHNSALGAAASVTDLVTAKTLELQKAQQQGAGLTQQQIDNQKRLAAENALGTYQIQSQIDAEKVRTATLFMGTEAATSYATSQTIINKAIQDGKPLTADQVSQIKAASDAYAKAKTQSDNYSEAITGVSSAMSGTLTTGVADILDGTKSVGQGFADMSKLIVRSIEEAIIKLLIVKPLIDSLTGGVGGLFGVGGTGTVANGGIVLGSAAGPGVFAAANGGTFGPGWGVVGERGPELINVHSRGVTVVPNHVSRPFLPGFAEGGMLSANGNVTRLPFGQDTGSVTVNVHNAPDGTTATAKAQRDSNGGLNIEVMLDAANAKNLANPGSASRQVLGQVGRVASR